MLLEIKDLTKRYGNRYAIREISFSADKGDILGFLGQNGAGKSTTMNIVSGYTAATSGSVLINGVDFRKSPREFCRQTGYLPEIPPLYPEMTVREYLTFVCEIKEIKAKRIRSHVDELCEMLQLTDHCHRLIRNLSKGYRQRVGIAQALVGDPEILLLDEPTVGLDPLQMQEIRSLIRQLKEQHTIILSSHLLSEVTALCNRAVILHHGQLVAEDSLSHLTGCYQALSLRVGASAENIRPILERITEISDIKFLSPVEASACDLYITAQPQSDVRQAVSLQLARAGYPILLMKPAQNSLEEVFLHLTGNEEELPS